MNDWQRLQVNDAMIRLAHGDRDAFGTVFEGLWQPVLAYMRRALPGHPDVEDLAQRTLLKIFSRVSDFDTSRDGVSWAFGIATYEVKTLRRQVLRRGEIPLVAANDAAVDGRSPENVAIDADLHDALANALGRLSSADRAALLGESASAPGVNAPAWRKRRQRAFQRLKAIWRNANA